MSGVSDVQKHRPWARHDAEACEGASQHIGRPRVGGLRLNRDGLDLDASAPDAVADQVVDCGQRMIAA